MFVLCGSSSKTIFLRIALVHTLSVLGSAQEKQRSKEIKNNIFLDLRNWLLFLYVLFLCIRCYATKVAYNLSHV